MKVASIRIKGILGIEDLTIEPGALTVISGKNAKGKTSVLVALKDLAEGGHDPTLIRRGADQGSVSMKLDNGVEISKVIRPAKSVTTVTDPKLGKISKPATWIKEVLDGFSVDPVQFLVAGPKLQVDILLGALPVQLDWAAVKEIVPHEYTDVNPEQHPLKVLNDIKARVFSKRRELNTSAREKRATASQMRDALPQAPEGEGPNWKAELERLIEHRSTLEREASREIERLKGVASVEIGRLETEKNERIEALRKAFNDQVHDLEVEHHESCEHVHSYEREAIDKVRGKAQPEIDDVSEAIGTATEKVEAEAKAAQARETVAKFEADAATVEQNATVLTKALDRIQTMKNDFLRILPIPGLELFDEEIQVDGIPFNRLNDAERHRIAIEIAKLKASKLGLILMDRAEIFDAASWSAFVDTALKSGLQIIAAKVSDDELAVQTERLDAEATAG